MASTLLLDWPPDHETTARRVFARARGASDRARDVDAPPLERTSHTFRESVGRLFVVVAWNDVERPASTRQLGEHSGDGSQPLGRRSPRCAAVSPEFSEDLRCGQRPKPGVNGEERLDAPLCN